MHTPTKLDDMLAKYPEFEKLAFETELLREAIDDLPEESKQAIEIFMQIDSNMLTLMTYHQKLTTLALDQLRLGI